MTYTTEAVVTPKKEAVKPGRMSAQTMAANRAEEPALIRAWQEDGCSKSLSTLISRYAPMIGSQIHKILAGRSVGIAHRNDLEQEANLAFISAVSSFDPSFGTHLSSFAMNHVRSTLLRYALDFRHSYRIGTSSAERKAYYAALSRRAERIHAGDSEVLSDEDIVAIQKNTGSSFQSTKRAVASIYARSTNLEDEPDLADGHGAEVMENDISVTSAMDALAPFIATLDDRQEAILKLYLADEDINAQEMANTFNLTAERIGQIRREMLTDMAMFLKKQGISAQDLF
jgi:RNA polymerase sigma factor (sigma-70 family)